MTPSKKLAFYISPHQDDWILFRGEQAYIDLLNANVVIILITAGDSGLTDWWWQAREEGAIAAIIAVAPQSSLTQSVEMIAGVNLHPITKYTFENGACYCLRLPDHPNNPNLSALLRDSPPSVTLPTIDGSTSYESWLDLCETIKSIVELECNYANFQNPWVHAPLYTSTFQIGPRRGAVNPHDHPDHTATGFAVRSFAKDFCHRAWWWSYAITGRNDMLISNATMLNGKKILFDTYCDTIKKHVEQNGNRQSSISMLNTLSSEWQNWGAYSHAELANLGTPDPYILTGKPCGYWRIRWWNWSMWIRYGVKPRLLAILEEVAVVVSVAVDRGADIWMSP